MNNPWSAEEHARIRALFPGAVERPYFDIAARGLISTRVRDAVAAYMDERMAGGADKQSLWAVADEARTRFATLVGAHPDEIAIVKNVSEGLNLFAASLPWKATDNVVVCPQVEHPNNVFLWYNLRDRLGIEVREVAPEEGRVPVAAMAAAVDAHTRLITVPSVSFAPGFVTDVTGIVRAAEQHGALTLVDAAQSIGGVATDVRALGVSAATVATQKCLLSLYGLGFLYVRREVAETLTPALVGRYGVDLGEGAHETALGDGPLRFQPGARRFDLSNHNYLGATAAAASLALIEELGSEQIEAHTRSVATSLAHGLADLGLPVEGGADAPDRAHIVCVGHAGSARHYDAGDDRLDSVYRHLSERGARLSIRSGTLRFSVGVYNDLSDVDAVCGWAREALES